MEQYRLFMVLIGCRPTGRNTEQHDIFFGIAKELRDLVPAIKVFWKGTSPLHVDAWRIINNVEGNRISVVQNSHNDQQSSLKLFFLNLGGYKKGCFEEFHYKMLTVAKDKREAEKNAKQTAFFLHTGFDKFDSPHIDDRFGIDVDDLFEIKDILSEEDTGKFAVNIEPMNDEKLPEDTIHLGYFKLQDL